MRLRHVVLAGFALISMSRPMAGQATLPQPHSRVTLLAANTGLGMVTAVLGQVVRGARIDPRKAAQGAVGGAMVFSGKAIVAKDRWYANLFGRQIAAIGGSGIQNVASGNKFLDKASLPYGPLRFNIERESGTRLRVKLDLARTGVLVMALSDVHMEMDVRKSLLYGVAVFRDNSPNGDNGVAGSHVGGVVTYREVAIDGLTMQQSLERTMAHELIHVLQADFSFNTWGTPIERTFMKENETTRKLYSYFDLGLDVPLASLANSFISYSSRPWEREAVSLSRRR